VKIFLCESSELTDGAQANQEPVTLKQQEDMQIRGKSARQMVMQKLMGARGKVDSVVLLLKNMVICCLFVAYFSHICVF
jgi:hypothetical protein